MIFFLSFSSLDGIDPYAVANADDSGAGAKDHVHVRVQQRNGRKSLTTVLGLKKEYSYSKIPKDLKKEFCCNGTVVQDPDLGQFCTYPCGFKNFLERSFNFWVIKGRTFPPSSFSLELRRRKTSRFMVSK
ncbi:hypothetical protein NC652_037683 [Populus alba x Populus x berolinensis]|nr:hypothetical protein NC652_037683 [Populus alba x Populus x berolinensis]